MATREIIALDEATPQLLAPQAGDTYLAPRPVGISVGTLTTDQKPLDISATFNNAAVTFTGIKANFTDTASASGSKLLDVQKGGTSQLVLDKNGNLGVGTASPAYKFDVAGTARFSASSNSFVFANTVSVFNNAAADVDFQVKGDTDANLVFVDASTDRVGIGTNAPAYKLDVRSNAPSVKSWVSSVNTSATAGGAGFISLLSGVSGTPYSTFNTLSEGSLEIENIGISGAGAILFRNTGDERMRIDASGNVVINTAAIATNATNGFLYVPSCAGTPTGTPTAYTGRVPIVVDTTNNKLYFYSGGQWRDAGP